MMTPEKDTHRRFRDRVVIVTGAGSGIGRITAGRFAEEGASVVVADIDGDAAEVTARELTMAGSVALPVEVDVTDGVSVRAMMASVEDSFEGVDILVNNAAVASDTDFMELSEEQWDRDVDVALRGSFLCSQAVLTRMLAKGSGVILNLGSINSFSFLSNDAYSAAKAGLVSLTRGLAVRYGPRGIRCNLVAPGTIRTPAWDARVAEDPDLLDRLVRWYPLRRVGTPEDVVAALAFLASDEAAWITGISLVVDGGFLAGNPVFSTDLSS